MSEQQPTAAEALGLGEGDALERALAGLEAIDTAASLLAAATGHELRDGIAAQVAEQVRAVLEIPVARVLAEAFAGYVTLAKYADAGRYPPECRYRVGLGRHQVEWLQPVGIDLLVTEQRIGTLELGLVLSGEARKAELVVQGGSIRELAAGELAGTLSLRHGDRELAGREVAIELAKALRFADGIPILPVVPLGAGIPVAAPPPSTESAPSE